MTRQNVMTWSQHTVDICGELNFALFDKSYEMLWHVKKEFNSPKFCLAFVSTFLYSHKNCESWSPLPDPLSQLCWICAKTVHLSFCGSRYYLCYFPLHSLNILRTNVHATLRPFKKSCLNFAQRQTCLVAITSPLSPPPKKKFKLNPLRLFYSTQEGFIGQFCDCLQI